MSTVGTVKRVSRAAMKSIAVAVFLLMAASVLRAKPVVENGVISLNKGLGDVWSDCSKSSDPAKLMSVTLQPDPPKKGEGLTVSANFSVSETVSGGQIAVKVKYGIITVFHQTLNLCDVAKDANFPCPISPGTHAVTYKLPENIPNISGHITGNAEVTDQSGKELACINLDFHL